MKLTYNDFKHNYNQRPFTLTINRQSSCCPIHMLLECFALRGNHADAIFITHGGIPVAQEVLARQLSAAIRLCGLDPVRCKGHSFRIGAASYATGKRMSDSQIRLMGRWKSNAFHKYVRISSMSTSLTFDTHHDALHNPCIACGLARAGSAWPRSSLLDLLARTAISFKWHCIRFSSYTLITQGPQNVLWPFFS